MFRVGAPAVLETTFSALLAWGYTGQSAPAPRIPNNALPVAASQARWAPASWSNEAAASSRAATTSRGILKPVEPLSLEQARKIAARFARGSVGDVEIVDTDSGPAIVLGQPAESAVQEQNVGGSDELDA